MSYVVHYRDESNQRQTMVFYEATTGGHAKNLFNEVNERDYGNNLSLIRVKKYCKGCKK